MDCDPAHLPRCIARGRRHVHGRPDLAAVDAAQRGCTVHVDALGRGRRVGDRGALAERQRLGAPGGAAVGRDRDMLPARQGEAQGVGRIDGPRGCAAGRDAAVTGQPGLAAVPADHDGRSGLVVPERRDNLRRLLGMREQTVQGSIGGQPGSVRAPQGTCVARGDDAIARCGQHGGGAGAAARHNGEPMHLAGAQRTLQRLPGGARVHAAVDPGRARQQQHAVAQRSRSPHAGLHAGQAGGAHVGPGLAAICAAQDGPR